MKAVLPLILGLTWNVLASPADLPTRGDETYELLTENQVRDLADVGSLSSMEFFGPITPGGANVTLFGSAQDIYQQILQLNPDYDVWAFPDYAAKLEAKGLTREDLLTPESLEQSPAFSLASNTRLMTRQDGINCGIRDWVGGWNQCIDGMTYLMNLGGAWCRASAGSCARVSCSYNCGMWLCNKMDKQLSVYCTDIPGDINAIANKCIDTFGRIRGRRAFTTHNIELGVAGC